MNVMTEEEAKGRACCSGAQRPSENGSCIASSCMAWRWGYETERRHPAGPDDPDPPVDEGWERYTGTYGAPDYWARWVRDRGYCGLAGSPTP